VEKLDPGLRIQRESIERPPHCENEVVPRATLLVPESSHIPAFPVTLPAIPLFPTYAVLSSQQYHLYSCVQLTLYPTLPMSSKKQDNLDEPLSPPHARRHSTVELDEELQGSVEEVFKACPKYASYAGA
jgi:hypothetical protein